MKAFLRQIVETCCKIHFHGIDPKKVHFYFTRPNQKFLGKRRLMGIWRVSKSKIVIQIDKEFSENADEASITAKIAHELAHVKLKHPQGFSLENEEAAEEEVKKFFKKWVQR